MTSCSTPQNVSDTPSGHTAQADARPVPVRHSEVTTSAHAKVILLGEHSVLYGHPALALGLPMCPLEATWQRCPPEESRSPHFLSDSPSPALTLEQRLLLNKVWLQALSLAGADDAALEEASSGFLAVTSSFPFGAGLGASAALCLALLQLARAFLGITPAHFATLVQEATQLEAHFHGRSSGLDPAACFADGCILFYMGSGAVPLIFGRQGCLALVDSLERKQTRQSITQVSEAHGTGEAKARLERLGNLAYIGYLELMNERLHGLGRCMNLAHAELSALGLSTPALDARVHALRSAGALGAKLSGAGLGGMAIGLFETRPKAPLPFPVWRWVDL